MKEEAINKLTEKALQYLDSAEAFVGKEVPIYIQELLEFKFMEHLLEGVIDTAAFTVFIGTVVAIAFVGFTGVFVEEHIGKKAEDCYKYLIFSAFLGYVSAAIIGVFCNSGDFISAYKAKNAPRVYLVDYFRGKN